MGFSLKGFPGRLPSLRLCLLILSLTAQPVSSQIEVDQRTCGALHGQIFATFREAINMADFAYQRTLALRDGTLEVGEKWTTFHTFRTFWTRMALHSVPPMYGLVDPDAKVVGDRMINMFNYIRKFYSNQPQLPVKIWCADDWIKSSRTDRDGRPFPVNIYTRYYFDEMQQGAMTRFWLPYDHKKCEDDPAVEGYTLYQYDYIILCPPSLPPRMATAIGNARNADYSRTPGALIDRFTTTSVVILHELFHLFYNPTMAPSTGRAEVYHFRACTNLARGDPLTALTMPDCLAYYAFSLWMSGNDWSIGRPRPYGVII